jgi:hypothetical protein
MNSPQIAPSPGAGQMRSGQRSAYHQSVDVGVIAVRPADEAACAAEADG